MIYQINLNRFIIYFYHRHEVRDCWLYRGTVVIGNNFYLTEKVRQSLPYHLLILHGTAQHDLLELVAGDGWTLMVRGGTSTGRQVTTTRLGDSVTVRVSLYQADQR